MFLFLILLSVLSSSCTITSNTVREVKYELEGECILSLCDCQCYNKGQLPEYQEGKICGNDCKNIYDIEECVYHNHQCVIRYSDRDK
jgi:hypothetical protein